MQPPKQIANVDAWPALRKKNHVYMVQPKKNILTNHRQPVPTSSLADLSHLQALLLYKARLSQKLKSSLS